MPQFIEGASRPAFYEGQFQSEHGEDSHQFA
jgi:hypothetical protein